MGWGVITNMGDQAKHDFLGFRKIFTQEVT